MKWYEIVQERILSNLVYKPNMKIVIDATFHSDDRKFRHNDVEIPDKEIIAVCMKAIPDLIRDLVNDSLTMRDEMVIRDSKSKLNVVCQLRGGPDLKNLKLVVITVMIKENFKPKVGTKVYDY